MTARSGKADGVHVVGFEVVEKIELAWEARVFSAAAQVEQAQLRGVVVNAGEIFIGVEICVADKPGAELPNPREEIGVFEADGERPAAAHGNARECPGLTPTSL